MWMPSSTVCDSCRAVNASSAARISSNAASADRPRLPEITRGKQGAFIDGDARRDSSTYRELVGSLETHFGPGAPENAVIRTGALPSILHQVSPLRLRTQCLLPPDFRRDSSAADSPLSVLG